MITVVGDTGEVSISVDGASDAATDDNTTPLTIAQSGWLVGTVVGLEAAAIGCLAYAWVFRTPDDAAYGLDNTLSVLVRTSALVITSAVLAALCLVVGRAHQRSTRRRARFLTLTAPALAVIGGGGLLALARVSVTDIFDAAAREQISLQSHHHVLIAAKVAWLCACLALIALAAVTMLAHFKGVERDWFQGEPRRPMLVGAVLAIAIPLIITSVTLFSPGEGSPFKGETASSVSVPPAADSAKSLSYREPRGLSAGSLYPAGAGYVRVEDDDNNEDTDVIEGFNGRSGERQWWFSAEKLRVQRLWSTGTGDTSVVAAKVFQNPTTTIPRSPVVGIDATTGRLLWTRQFDNLAVDERALRGVSNNVLILQQELPEPAGTTASANGTRWLAVAPRTGELLWSRDFGYDCFTRGHLTDDAIVLSTCDTGRDLIATVLDPRTGKTRKEIRRSEVGADLTPETRVDVRDARGNLAILTFDDYGTDQRPRVAWDALVDLTTGEPTHRFADHFDAVFIDGRSILLSEYIKPRDTYALSVFQIASRLLIPTGHYLFESPQPSSVGAEFPAAALADSWVVLAGDRPISRGDSSREVEASFGLRHIETSGSVTDLSPCGDTLPRRPVSVPGALSVRCGEDLLGLN